MPVTVTCALLLFFLLIPFRPQNTWILASSNHPSHQQTTQLLTSCLYLYKTPPPAANSQQPQSLLHFLLQPSNAHLCQAPFLYQALYHLHLLTLHQPPPPQLRHLIPDPVGLVGSEYTLPACIPLTHSTLNCYQHNPDMCICLLQPSLKHYCVLLNVPQFTLVTPTLHTNNFLLNILSCPLSIPHSCHFYNFAFRGSCIRCLQYRPPDQPLEVSAFC